MAERIRQIAQRLKDKVHLQKINTTSRDKVDQFITKYAPASKVLEIAEKFKHGAVTQRVQELVHKYEKFTGVEEIMAIQNTVIEAQVWQKLLLIWPWNTVLGEHTELKLDSKSMSMIFY